ncbi:hypothetical protein ETH98_08310 [Macrococcoides caseolyticum]|uniref:hypothetical protein n=1 Tax=Macrococcoides caseolyticum TaxID=69966 RepID=UPI00105C1FD1|nr:hypothetical protein [Macrococcus caseolyticus]TDM28726.1 hypothetical protein ETH98_08310 [Macrococcus caseolyticus]
MKVSSEFGKSIIDNYKEPSRNVSHQDRYYYLDGKEYVAIDNRSGECFVEVFSSEIQALAYTDTDYSYETIESAYEQIGVKTYKNLINACAVIENY